MQGRNGEVAQPTTPPVASIITVQVARGLWPAGKTRNKQKQKSNKPSRGKQIHRKRKEKIVKEGGEKKDTRGNYERVKTEESASEELVKINNLVRKRERNKERKKKRKKERKKERKNDRKKEIKNAKKKR